MYFEGEMFANGLKHNFDWMLLIYGLFILTTQPSSAESGICETPPQQKISEYSVQTADIGMVNKTVSIPQIENIHINPNDVRRVAAPGYSGNWWMKAGWDNHGKLPNVSAALHDYVKISESTKSKKINWSVVAKEFTMPYTDQLNIDYLVADYQDIVFSGLSEMSGDFAENIRSITESSNPDAWKWFDRFFSFLSVGKSIPGTFRLDPSLGFGHAGLNCSYKLRFGTINYSWNMDKNKSTIKVRIPLYPSPKVPKALSSCL